MATRGVMCAGVCEWTWRSGDEYICVCPYYGKGYAAGLELANLEEATIDVARAVAGLTVAGELDGPFVVDSQRRGREHSEAHLGEEHVVEVDLGTGQSKNDAQRIPTAHLYTRQCVQ